jgi:hypothetical protein
MLGFRPKGNDGILYSTSAIPLFGDFTAFRIGDRGSEVFMLGFRPKGNDGILYSSMLSQTLYFHSMNIIARMSSPSHP